MAVTRRSALRLASHGLWVDLKTFEDKKTYPFTILRSVTVINLPIVTHNRNHSRKIKNIIYFPKINIKYIIYIWSLFCQGMYLSSFLMSGRITSCLHDDSGLSRSPFFCASKKISCPAVQSEEQTSELLSLA